MNTTWWLTAIAMVLAFPLLLRKGGQLVSRLTGREGQSHRPFAYDAIYFALALVIGLPPVYLFPDSDPLFYFTFWSVGILVGSLTAQAFIGRRHA